MKKVIVIGCPGSGKSTFSKALHKITSLPLFHLDMMFWNKDKTTVERPVFLERLSGAMENDEWIIDGNYASTMEMRMKECDTVIFLDYPVEVCLQGIKDRKGKPRTDIPWIETEDDEEFIQYIKDFNLQSRPQMMNLLSKYAHKDIYIFKNRTEADEFLNNVKDAPN